MNPTAGTVLSQRYTLTGRIAAGGMGEVWAATDTVLGRTVAVKLLNPALSQQSGFLDRFRAEARNAASLHHPNITTVFDYGEDDGAAYLVMELVAGQPLSRIIAEQAPLSASTTSSILIQAATALEAAHRGGVIHRDVKPANILVTPDGTAKLTDFGISRLVSAAPLTQTGEVLGTAQYLSPEQVTGQSANAASDIYALGVVGHEMLTGQRPFDGDTLAATAFAHVDQPAPPLPDTVPPGIRTVIGAALAKDPADRPATAAAMATALGMPDATPATGRPGPGIPADRTQVLPAAGLSAPPASALLSGEPSSWARGAQTPARAAAASTGMAALTQAMPVLAADPRADRPGIPDRRSRLHPAWLLGAAAAVAIGLVTAFALPGGGSTETPAARISPPISVQNVAPESTGTTTEIASPQASPTAPDRRDRGKGRTRGHDDKKDGKQ